MSFLKKAVKAVERLFVSKPVHDLIHDPQVQQIATKALVWGLVRVGVSGGAAVGVVEFLIRRYG